MKDLRSEPGVAWKDFPHVTVPGDQTATGDPSTWTRAALLKLTYPKGAEGAQIFTRLRAGWASRHGLQLRLSGDEDGGFSTYDVEDETDPMQGIFAMKVGNEDVVFYAFAVGNDMLSEIESGDTSLELIGVVNIDDPEYADIPLV